MKRISSKAVVIGSIVDVVASSVLGFPLVMFVLISRGIARLPKEQMQPALLAAIHGSPALHASQLAIGAVCSVLGGYVAARLAKHDLVLNGLVSAWGCVILGIYSIARGKSSEPLLFQLMLLFVITPLAAAAGGYVKAKR